MVKLALVPRSTTATKKDEPAAHRAARTEGEAVRQLVEGAGYPVKKASSNQFEVACPFHEEPGPVPRNKSANFYINRESGLYFCLAGETLVQTRDGAVPIQELAGTSPEILTTQLTNVDSVVRRDGRWVTAPIRSFGQQALMRVTIERLGQRREVYATPEHRWMVRDQSKSGFAEHTTNDLSAGDRLVSLFPTTKVATAVPSSIGIAHGATYGDGTIATNGAGRIALHGEKRELLRYFPEPQTWDSVNENGHPVVTVGGLPKAWKQLPSLDEGVAYLYGWLAGYLATDGTVSKTGVVALESYDPEALAHVETLCLKLGIHTYGVRSYKHEGISGVINMMHRLAFASASLPDALFVRTKHRTRRLNARPDAAYRTWVVTNVEATDRFEEVFCATVEETGVFALAEGLLTGNCHSASCGEKGNLQTLERHFGIDTAHPAFQGRESKLKHFEELLTPERRKVLYDEGLNDTTIERFRVGWVDEYVVHNGDNRTRVATNCYVFPYMEGRRAVAFRFYDPQCQGPNGSKYWWEPGVTAPLYNISDAIGDKDGKVFIAEGEKKAMLLTQLGYAAVGLPGAGNFKKEWHQHFTHAKRVIICFDNDNPEHHVYAKCNKCGEGKCVGHNPGQEAAIKLVEQFGWRATNVVLPLPEGERKADVNEYFVRDGNTSSDFAELALGVRKAPYIVSSLAMIEEDPPDEAAFVVGHGILPKGGRLLISGQPKTGKSILAEHLALSVASGIPLLHRFGIDRPEGRRVLLLDRELSQRALYDRLQEFIAFRPGYKVGRDNLLIDHDHQIRLDLKESYDHIAPLVEQNGAEVIILDTAYKFFQGDMESSGALMKVFDTLDKLIQSTGVSVVVTHHQRKKVSGQKRGQSDIGDPDNVAGSFLWTGWPNASILLDFMDRRLNSPFNVVASFVSFRDAAPPEPLALYRDKDSINYSAIQDYVPDDGMAPPAEMRDVRPSTETVGDMLIKVVPTVEDDFLHLAATKFGCRVDTIRPFLIDLIDKGLFTKTNGRPPVIKYAGDKEEESYEQEHGMSEVDTQLELVTEIENTAPDVRKVH